jgi:hypothetical protein
MVIIYDEAVYLKDDIEGTRVLFHRAQGQGKSDG